MFLFFHGKKRKFLYMIKIQHIMMKGSEHRDLNIFLYLMPNNRLTSTLNPEHQFSRLGG